MIRANLFEQKLAALPGKLIVSAIDGASESRDTSVILECPKCLWDTGAQVSCITSDLLPAEFLTHPIHDMHRQNDRIQVEVHGKFSSTNATFELSAMWNIVSKSSVASQRCGVILGQHTFIDRILVRSNPRALLKAQGEGIGTEYWGDINIEKILHLDDEVQEL